MRNPATSIAPKRFRIRAHSQRSPSNVTDHPGCARLSGFARASDLRLGAMVSSAQIANCRVILLACRHCSCNGIRVPCHCGNNLCPNSPLPAFRPAALKNVSNGVDVFQDRNRFWSWRNLAAGFITLVCAGVFGGDAGILDAGGCE
jgi:hypothetical protein